MIFILSFLFGQDDILDYQISAQKYFTDTDGKIKMYVNVWGHVNRPGLHEVYDGIDLATLFSVVGGPKSGAKLKNIKLYRETPDLNGETVFEINFKNFADSGNRQDFVKIKPNDTIIIPQKFSNYLLSNAGTINTFLTMLNIYLQIERAKI